MAEEETAPICAPPETARSPLGTTTAPCHWPWRPFVSSSSGEDVLSANFALANAFVAEKNLSGPHLYVDNNLVELLAENDKR